MSGERKIILFCRFVSGPLASILLLAVLLAPLPTDAASLTEGLRKYQAGDYAGAVDEWQPLADRGDPDALFNMGQVYRLGRGVAADENMAVEYYRRAGIAGHAGAKGALATIYYFDDASRQKRGEAIALWRQAAAGGDAPSQYTLAILYFNGQDVPRDLMQAYAWALLAAESGMPEGQKAEQTIRAKLSPNQMQQARVLKGALLLSPRAASPPTITAAAEPEVMPVDEPVENETASVEVAPTEETVAVAEAAPEVATAPVEAPVTETLAKEEVLPVAISPADTGPGGWSVQLGFYRGRDNAARDWESLAPRVESLMPGVASNIVTVDAGPERGIFYRLTAGSFDGRADADTLCNGLKDRGIDCVVKKP